MQIDHIAIYTDDLERLKTFYMKYFAGMSGDKYHNPKTGLQTYFITFGSGARLELMSRPGREEEKQYSPAYGIAHFAFCTGSREKVDDLTLNLVRDGYVLKSGPRETGDGYYESCILDPDSNEVEITV